MKHPLVENLLAGTLHFSFLYMAPDVYAIYNVYYTFLLWHFLMWQFITVKASSLSYDVDKDVDIWTRKQTMKTSFNSLPPLPEETS